MKVLFLLFALVVVANAGSSLHTFAPNEVKERCPYAGYQSSQYCPSFTAFANEFMPEKVERSSHPMLKGLVGLGVDLPSAKVNEGGVKTGGLFSDTISASDLLTSTFIGEHNQAAAVLLDERTAYHVRLGSSDYPSFALDANFQASIDYLPAAYDASLYHLLIEYWGTHVVTEGFFGGNLQQEYIIKECLYSASGDTMNDTTIVAQLGKDFQKFMNPSATGPTNNRYINSRQAVKTRIDGGNPDIDNKANRIKSFEADPVLTKLKYMPLWKFVKDSTKQANVRRAISEHIQKVGATQSNNIARAVQQAKANYLGPKPVTVAVNSTMFVRERRPSNEVKYVSNIKHLNLAAGQSYHLSKLDMGPHLSHISANVRRLADGRIQAYTNQHIGGCTRRNAEPVSCGCSVVTFDCYIRWPDTRIWWTVTVDACLGCELHTYTPTGISPKCHGCQAMTCDCPTF